MEEGIRRRGVLYLQQQRFGKKWRKVCCVLYHESTCSVSRLEFYEFKDGGSGTLEKSKCKQDNKKVIKMSDCIRVSDADVDGCPRDCRAFLVETTEKIFVFAVDAAEVDGWKQELCEIAFPMNWTDRGATRKSSMQNNSESVTADNSLYGGREAAMKDFKVTVRATDTALRCGLRGSYLLRTGFDSLLLKEPKTGEVLYTWPYRYLRRFGRDKVTFSFEAGRRCDSGEGNFEFDTKQGNTIFQSVEAAINLQRTAFSQRQLSSTQEREEAPLPSRALLPVDDSTVYSMLTGEAVTRDAPKPPSPHRSRTDAPSDKHLTGVKSLNIDARPAPRKSQVKNFRSCPLSNTANETYSRVTAPVQDRTTPEASEELKGALSTSSRAEDPEYSLPFDNINQKIMVDILASQPQMIAVKSSSADDRSPGEKSAEPLYDSIDESAIRSSFQARRHPGLFSAAEHIYDEPEGCAVTPSNPTSLYDEPEEVKGQAWKTLASAADPSGHEFPYNAQADDYAVPKAARRVLKEQTDDENSPYDNVILKMKASDSR